jgi:vacuolar-type H+-ATPase catalytic subunit A/Vma1
MNQSIDEQIGIFKDALSEIVKFDDEKEKMDFILDVTSIYSRRAKQPKEIKNCHDLSGLDKLIDYIENDVIGVHEKMHLIDEGIKMYAESYHQTKLNNERESILKLFPSSQEIQDFYEEAKEGCHQAGRQVGAKWVVDLVQGRISDFFEKY